MVWKKKAAAKSKIVQIEEPYSSVLEEDPKATSEATAAMEEKERQVDQVKVSSGKLKQIQSEGKADAQEVRVENDQEKNNQSLPLPREREANQPALTSFFKRTPVKPKGKSKGQVADKDDDTARTSTVGLDKRGTENTLYAELTSAKDGEKDDQEEHIPLRTRIMLQPQGEKKKKKMVLRKSTRSVEHKSRKEGGETAENERKNQKADKSNIVEPTDLAEQTNNVAKEQFLAEAAEE